MTGAADRIDIRHGDSRDVVATLPDASIDSVVCDPPYALVSIVNRLGAADAAPIKDRDGVYQRAAAGFMGQKWDTGETAFSVAFWRDVLRVLKPGGHLIAFGGTRTYHRLACAIEDAGFEIRDQIQWLYDSGFPKSHDVSKGIDKRRDWSALPKLQGAIRAARVALGISQSEAARRIGLIGPGESLGGGGFMWFETGKRVPTRDQWPALKSALHLGDDFDACFEQAEREVTGQHEVWTDRTNYAITSRDGLRRDIPATDAARQWQGWGTALKPACEPIVLGRKPLIGTVAANVLAHGTGAINIDGCRIHADDAKPITYTSRRTAPGATQNKTGATKFEDGTTFTGTTKEGRWPANVIHDGSDEVVAAFPTDPVDDTNAARFFYSAKADATDRLGSKHPTVKPVDLMAYLCRLVTPPGGTVLDPFAGSGSTGMACLREGFNAILIEREAEYVADIKRRVAHVSGGDAPLFGQGAGSASVTAPGPGGASAVAANQDLFGPARRETDRAVHQPQTGHADTISNMISAAGRDLP